MIMPRALIVEHGKYPEATHTDKDGGAPGKLWRPTSQEFQAESDRFSQLMQEMPAYFLTASPDSVCDWGTAQRLYRKLASTGTIEQKLGTAPTATGLLPESAARMKRQYLQILEDTQWLMREGEFTRREFWKKADFKSLSGFTNSVQQYRDYFWDEIIGRLPKHPRCRIRAAGSSRRDQRLSRLRSLVLDVHPDVFAMASCRADEHQVR
jgi:hypothetical protein